MYSSHFKEELQIRWKKIQSELNQSNADALLISTSANLYYSSGRVFSGFAYFIKHGVKPIFFVKRPVGFSTQDVFYIRKPEEIISHLETLALPLPHSLMIETDIVPYNEVNRYKSIFSNEINILNGAQLMRVVRSVKTDYEIEQLRESGRLHDMSYAKIKDVYREGMTDRDFAIEIERLTRINGSMGYFRIAGASMESFMGSVVAGENADTPSPYDFALGGAGENPSLPVGCNDTKLSEGVSIMVDVGGNFTGYMTDMSRVFSIGNISELAYKAHDVSLEILRTLEKSIKPGVKAADMYTLASNIASEHSLGDYFMGYTQKASFIGHGIGIEINELPVLSPRSRDIFAKNMVVALEPKFVIPNVGAVGIENSYVVTDNGLMKLTFSDEHIIMLSTKQ